MTEPQVLILDEPTRGIDVGAKAEVHHVVGEMARQGKAMLMISSDLPEVLAVSDRIVVMKEGRVTARLNRAEATQQRVMTAATQGDGAAVEKIRSITIKERSAEKWWLRFREAGIAV